MIAVSFQLPEYTAEIDGLGALRILDSIKNNSKKKKIKYYQAGSSEMYGGIQKKSQNEQTNFEPQSPYAASKVFAHNLTKIYRDGYGIFACNGILFNHESPFRGETFVTKKIVKGLIRIKQKKLKTLYLGNIYAKRDWGHAKDYVEAMWKIINHKKPDDFVIATNHQITIKQFINLVCKKINLNIKWTGKGLKEVGISDNKIIIQINKRYFRPLEVSNLRGNFNKAKKILNWKPKVNLTQLIDDMIEFELKNND